MPNAEDSDRSEIDAQILAIAEDLVAGRVSPLVGAESIWSLSLDAPWYGHALDTFVYGASEWHELRVTSEMRDQWSSAIIETAKDLLDSARRDQRT